MRELTHHRGRRILFVMGVPARGLGASVTTTTIASGDAGTFQTLALMAQLINEGADNPAVIAAARRVATFGGSRTPAAQAFNIRSFLASVWSFVDDPMDRELLTDAPAMLLDYANSGAVHGDCDEAAILGATFGKVVGLDVTLTVLAFPDPETAPAGDEPYSHVFATLLTPGGGAVSLDITKPVGPVPTPTREYTIDV